MKQHLSALLLLGCSVIPVTGCLPLAVGGAAATTASAIVDDRPAGRMLDDTNIKIKIKNKYTQTDVNDLLPNVTVGVHQGRVLLTGVVNNEQTILRAVELAWQVEGVREVINEIQLRSQVSLARLGKDTMIANSVRTRLIGTEGIRSANYIVECFNGVVYLLGIAHNQTELNAANQVAARTQGVRKVVSHVKLIGDSSVTNPPPQGGIMAPETSGTGSASHYSNDSYAQPADSGSSNGWTETSPDEIAPQVSGTPSYDDPYADDVYSGGGASGNNLMPLETGEVPDAY